MKRNGRTDPRPLERLVVNGQPLSSHPLMDSFKRVVVGVKWWH